MSDQNNVHTAFDVEACIQISDVEVARQQQQYISKHYRVSDTVMHCGCVGHSVTLR